MGRQTNYIASCDLQGTGMNYKWKWQNVTEESKAAVHEFDGASKTMGHDVTKCNLVISHSNCHCLQCSMFIHSPIVIGTNIRGLCSNDG